MWLQRLRFAGVALAVLVGTVPAAASTKQERFDLLVGLSDSLQSEEVARIAQVLMATHVEELADINVVRVQSSVPLGVARELIRTTTAVSFVESNKVGALAASPPSPPNDPQWNGSTNWRLTRANVPRGWAAWPGRYVTAKNKDRFGVSVAVLDGPIDTSHPDFANKGSASTNSQRGGQLDLENARTFISANQAQGSLAWHGTFIAGIVGAATSNAKDIAGVGFGARVMPVVVADGEGRVSIANAARGITHAVNQGARVVNMSFVIPSQTSKTLERAVRYAAQRDALLVAAAGNTGTEANFLPGALASRHRNVMAVAASNVLDGLAACSSTGRHVSVAAPGTDIVSLRPGGGTMFAACGTSAATAMVSGIAASVLGRWPGMRAPQLRNRIEQTADPLPADALGRRVSSGRINAEAAMSRPTDAQTQLLRPVPGARKVIISAKAHSARGVRAARFSIDGSAWKPIRNTDSAWGGHDEKLRATLDVSKLSDGVHQLLVSSADSGGWGPAASSVLIVDRVPAAITEVKTEPAVVVPGDPSTRLHLTIADALSRDVAMLIEFLDTSGGVQARHAYRLPPGAYRAPWRGTVDRPGGEHLNGKALPPGRYVIRVSVTDEAGNRSVAEGATVIAPDPRR